MSIESFGPEAKIFGGKYNGFQRYDKYLYPQIKKLEKNMRGAFWTPEEISCERDRINFPNLPKHIQEILKRNLVFQTLMDSGQNRGVDGVLAELTTLPETEALFKTLAYFEYIHSLTYSEIVRAFESLFAQKIFDTLSKNEKILSRMDKETDLYNMFKSFGGTTIDEIITPQIEGLENLYKLAENPESKRKIKETIQKQKELLNILLKDTKIQEELKKKLVELLIRIYALEGLKFYVSFLITYTINNSYSNAIPGATRMIKLINFDEDKHLAVMKNVIDILRNNEREGFSHIIKSKWFEEKAYEIFSEVVSGEIAWGKYLLSFGPIPSLSNKVIEMFVKYYADKRLKYIGLDPLYKQPSFDIIEWFEFYKDPNKDNTAQQEGESLNYNIGGLIDDLGDEIII